MTLQYKTTKRAKKIRLRKSKGTKKATRSLRAFVALVTSRSLSGV